MIQKAPTVNTTRAHVKEPGASGACGFPPIIGVDVSARSFAPRSAPSRRGAAGRRGAPPAARDRLAPAQAGCSSAGGRLLAVVWILRLSSEGRSRAVHTAQGARRVSLARRRRGDDQARIAGSRPRGQEAMERDRAGRPSLSRTRRRSRGEGGDEQRLERLRRQGPVSGGLRVRDGRRDRARRRW